MMFLFIYYSGHGFKLIDRNHNKPKEYQVGVTIDGKLIRIEERLKRLKLVPNLSLYVFFNCENKAEKIEEGDKKYSEPQFETTYKTPDKS